MGELERSTSRHGEDQRYKGGDTHDGAQKENPVRLPGRSSMCTGVDSRKMNSEHIGRMNSMDRCTHRAKQYMRKESIQSLVYCSTGSRKESSGS